MFLLELDREYSCSRGDFTASALVNGHHAPLGGPLRKFLALDNEIDGGNRSLEHLTLAVYK
jgi:hypothetical protein